MADLLVVTGPPGAGKSTLAPLVSAEFTPAAVVPGDGFFAFWTRGYVEPWLPEAHQQNEVVLRAAGAAAGTFVRGGCTVVYDGVLGPWLLPAFLEASGLPRLSYAVLLPSLERCLDQVRARTGHGFTDPAAAAHLHADFTGAEVDPRHVVPVAGEDPRETARTLLTRHRTGALTYPG